MRKFLSTGGQVVAKSRTQWHVDIWVCALLATVCSQARAQNPSTRPIIISVDATHARQRMLHSELQIPASPGSLTLYYPKWLPADHSPDGPISNITVLKFSSNGIELPWHKDDADMYTFQLDVTKRSDS